MDEIRREPDAEVERWFEWAIDVVGTEEWLCRRAAMEAFAAELDARAKGERPEFSKFTDPFQPSDKAAWYLYQCELYLRRPRCFDMPLCARIIPVLKTLGRHVDILKQIPLAGQRLRRGLVLAPNEMDSVLFELLVGQAYATRGWGDVTFIPEEPNHPTPDLRVRQHGELVAVECKRKRVISDYARREREKWWRISEPIRRALVQRGLAIVLDYTFHVPLPTLPEDYLERRVLPLLRVAVPGRLVDEEVMTVSMRPVDLLTVQRKLRHGMIRSDGTGLFRDLFGFRDLWRSITFSLYAKPNAENPRYLEEVGWAAASIWSCDATESLRAKAQHFRRELADAVRQLPIASPCVAHLGAEAYEREGIEAIRYERLAHEMIAGFDTEGRDIEVIYCHIFKVEVPPEENWAVEEDAHFWLRQPQSGQYLLEPTLLLAGDANEEPDN